MLTAGGMCSHSTTNAVAENETNSGKGAEETRKAKNLKKNGRGVWTVECEVRGEKTIAPLAIFDVYWGAAYHIMIHQ